MPADGADAHILAAGHAPTPFTADEIRDGCPEGRTVRLLVESEVAEPFIRINRFADCDDDGAIIEQWHLTAGGEPAGEIQRHRSTWLELQSHASFPADLTTIAPDTIVSPLGEIECLRYTVTDGTSVNTFWFAPSAPGMPVKYRGEDDGRVTGTVTVVSNESP
jgi:hypothetical protein